MLSNTPDTKHIIKTSCPRDCYDGCGVAVAVRDGSISLVTGNPEHPSNRGPLCGKCSAAYNGVWRDYGSRLLHPLRRVSRKGSGSYEAISWEEAFDQVAKQLKEIINNRGADRIYHTHYTGTCSSIAGSFPTRFFDYIGATEVDPDTVCNKAGHVAWNYVFGDSVNGFDPRMEKDSNCILVWGANPSTSAPHIDKMWLRSSRAKVIVVDPIRHETAENADLYLQVRPGSDAALAFAMMHVIVRDRLLDEEYIRKHVIGFEEVISDINKCSPEWGESMTGVPSTSIEKAATLYSLGPSIMWLGQGLQRQPQGGNIFRACAMLPAFTGNIGRPGTGAYYLNDTMSIGRRRGKSAPYEVEENHIRSVSQMDIPDLLQQPDTIEAYFVWNCNPLASNPAQELMRRGLAREDLFTVVVDCFMTDTADYADIVLPAASFLEFNDLCSSYFHLMVSPQVKCSEPMGEALPNQEIFRRLARSMGFVAPELFEDDQSMIEVELDDCGIGMDWEELKQIGWAYISDEPLNLWGDGQFSTPSGKIEIASEQARKNGLPFVPLPNVDPQPEDGKIRLISPADKYLMNSSYGNDKKVRGLMGPATVTIHPHDAIERGILDGSEVTLSNPAGELRMIAKISDAVTRGAALVHKSRWPKFEPENSNINHLHLPKKTDMGESTSVHGTEVLIEIT